MKTKKQVDLETQIFEKNEGWAIFFSYGTNGDKYELQRIDDEDAFDCDEDAWSYVREKALQGSKLHIDALEFLRVNSITEYNLITAS
jgi:hypothetical protein